MSYTIITSSTEDARLRALRETAERHGVPATEEPDRDAVHSYYAGFCFHIWLDRADGSRPQLADGGTVDWVAKLAGNAKERALISGAGVEGLLAARRG